MKHAKRRRRPSRRGPSKHAALSEQVLCTFWDRKAEYPNVGDLCESVMRAALSAGTLTADLDAEPDLGAAARDCAHMFTNRILPRTSTAERFERLAKAHGFTFEQGLNFALNWWSSHGVCPK